TRQALCRSERILHAASGNAQDRHLGFARQRLNRCIFATRGAFSNNEPHWLPQIQKMPEFSVRGLRIASRPLPQTPIKEVCIFKYRISQTSWVEVEHKDAHQLFAHSVHTEEGEDRPRRMEIQPNFWVYSLDFLFFP